MKLNQDLSLLVLSVWLILFGALPLFQISFPQSGTVLSLLAVAAGVLLLLGRRR